VRSKTLASGTGARVFQPMGASELDEAFTQILKDLRTQIPSGILSAQSSAQRAEISSGSRGPWRAKICGPPTRTGYYGDAPR